MNPSETSGFQRSSHIVKGSVAFLSVSHPLVIEAMVSLLEWLVSADVCWLIKISKPRWYHAYVGVGCSIHFVFHTVDEVASVNVSNEQPLFKA